MTTPYTDPNDPLVDRVIQSYIDRSAEGMIKYGTSLEANPAAILERITHAQEEAQDLTLYLEWLKTAVQALDQSIILDLEQKLAAVTAERDALKTELDQTKDELADLQGDIKDFSDKLEEMTKEFSSEFTEEFA